MGVWVRVGQVGGAIVGWQMGGGEHGGRVLAAAWAGPCLSWEFVLQSCVALRKLFKGSGRGLPCWGSAGNGSSRCESGGSTAAAAAAAAAPRMAPHPQIGGQRCQRSNVAEQGRRSREGLLSAREHG